MELAKLLKHAISVVMSIGRARDDSDQFGMVVDNDMSCEQAAAKIERHRAQRAERRRAE
jgi:hypothetical protein